MVEHSASYKLVKLRNSIGVALEGDSAIDLLNEPGQSTVGTLEDFFAEFETKNHRKVDPLLHPRAGVELNPAKLGGWPTIVGTRLPYDIVATLIEDGSVKPSEVSRYYPGVSESAAADALNYQQSVIGAA